MSEEFIAGARAPGRRASGLFGLASIILAFTASPCAAQSFDVLEARLADHPSVLALRSESEAREELAVAARALPDPAISLGVNNVPLSNPAFDRAAMTNKAIGVRQDIPNWGVRRARAEKERGEARASDLSADYQLSMLRAELIGALAEKQRIRAQIGYTQEKLKRYEELEGILRGEIEGGRAIYFRLSEVDVERAEVDSALAELDAALARVDAALVDLVGEAPEIAPPPVVLQPWDGEALALYATQIADAGIDTAKAGVGEGKAAFGPNFGVQLTYHQREASDPSLLDSFNGDDWFSAGVTFSVPLWAPKNQAPKLRAARARQAGAESSYQTAYRDVRERLISLQASHGAAERNIVLFDQKAKALDDTIAALTRNYEAGTGDYAQVLDAEIGKLTLLSQLAAERANAIARAADYNSELVTP